MRKFRLLAIFGLITCLQYSSRAQGYYTKQVGIDEGLSQPSVTCILSDWQGSVWIGTRFGLNKYRSNHIQNFGTHPSDPSGLDGKYIFSLYQDSDSLLWVGTESGLFVREHRADRFSAVTQQETVYSAAETPEVIYFGGTEGIHRYHKSTRAFTRAFAPLSESFIIRILPLDETRFLVVDRGLGLLVFDTADTSLTPVELPFLEGAIIMDACFYRGLLYAAVYNKGVYAINVAQKRCEQIYNTANSGLSFDVVLSLLEIDGTLWMGTDGGGLCCLQGGVISRFNDIGSFTCLYRDPLGTIWTGSVHSGAYALKTTDIRLYPSAHAGNGSVINGFWKDDTGTVWIATDGDGVNCYRPGFSALASCPHSEGLKIYSLTELDPDTLLLSVYGQGLQTYDKKSGKREPFIIVDPQVNAFESGRGRSPMLSRTRDGLVLIFATGAFVYNPGNRQFTRLHGEMETLDVNEMFHFGEDADGYLYTASKTGVFRIDVHACQVERVLSMPAKTTINAAALSTDGTIWLGTDEGLKYLAPGEEVVKDFATRQFTRVTELKAWRDAHLWIAADNLLFNMDRNGRVVILDEGDGFTANEILVSSISNTMKDKVLYLGGTRGFVEVKNLKPAQAAQALKLDLYEVSCGDRDLTCHTGGQVRIPWRYESLHIGIHLRGIEPFRKELYRFEVIGDRSHFVTDTYEDRIPLAGLTDGSYRILASYLQRDGSWSEVVHMLDLEVIPPWFRTWWFYTLLTVAALILLIYSVYAYNERSQRKLARTLSRWVETSSEHQDMDLIRKINRYVEDNLSGGDVSVSALARETAMSRASLYSKVKAITGMGVAQYVEDLRIRKACLLLKETQLSVAEISEQVGFSTPNYFSIRFKQAVGITPLTFRKNTL